MLSSPGAPYDPTDFQDLSGHGTGVAGIAAASASSQAPGIAYGANLVILRISSTVLFGYPAPGYANPVPDAINYFATLGNVPVMSLSQGIALNASDVGTATKWPAYTLDPVWESAALNAISQNKIIVAATGNDRYFTPGVGNNPFNLALYPSSSPPTPIPASTTMAATTTTTPPCCAKAA